MNCTAERFIVLASIVSKSGPFPASVLFGEPFASLGRCGPVRCAKKEVGTFVLAVAATNER
jgi:hypothetical protein